MGQSVTIACPPSWHLESFAAVLQAVAKERGAQFSSFDGQLQVIAEGARWKLVVNEVHNSIAATEEYASNDDLDERFRRDVAGLRFFRVIFDDIDVTRQALRAIAQEGVAQGEPIWIDTDYGTVIHAREFLKKSERGDWDWRQVT